MFMVIRWRTPLGSGVRTRTSREIRKEMKLASRMLEILETSSKIRSPGGDRGLSVAV